MAAITEPNHIKRTAVIRVMALSWRARSTVFATRRAHEIAFTYRERHVTTSPIML